MIGRHAETGQSYIILAILMVGMLAFSALALDGGMLLTEHRRSQNAADAAALAAAYAKIKGGTPFGIAALNTAATNEYPTTAQACDPPGLDCILGVGSDLSIQVTSPPRGGDYAGDPNYIHVIIKSALDTSFAHLVFAGKLSNQAEAVARIWPPQSYTPGYAIYALTEHDCKGVWFSGTGDTLVNGGGVFSNSDAASASCQSGVQGGGGAITVDPSYGIDVVGTFDIGGSGMVSPAPNEYATRSYIRPMPTPDCSALNDYGKLKINASQTVTVPPGRYQEISIGANANVTFDPGMYCIYGNKGIKGTGGTVTGTGVFFYLTDGPFDLGGNTLVQLMAEETEGVLEDPSSNDWKGMLIYMAPTNSNPVHVTGSSNTYYTGTIYAPSSEVTLEGTGDTLGVNAQVIGLSVKITGNADLDVQYEENKNYYLPAAIDLAK
jgi:hypothetical protein